MRHVLAPACACALLVSPFAPRAGAQESTLEEPVPDEWTALDRELETLEARERAQPEGPVLWGYLRANYAYSDDLRVPPNNETLSGWNLDNVRVNVSGETAGYAYRVTGEALAGTFFLEDAWAGFPVGEEVTGTLGRFKTPFLRSGAVEARDLLFIARTRNGVFYSVRDQGVMFNGDHGRLHWAAAAQNGADGTTEDWLTTLNVKVNLAGEDELPWEGAFRAGPGTRLSVGLSFSDDGALSDGTAWAVDTYLVHRGLSLTAEWVDYGMGYDNVFLGEQRGGTQPWSVTAGYMIVPETYELALRYEDFDDRSAPLDFERETFTVGVNRYVRGHDIKWQLNYVAAHKGGASDGLHEQIAALGLTVSF